MKSTLPHPAQSGDTDTPQQEITLLTEVLNASQSITTYCEAVREPATSQIVDFVYRFANEGVSDLIGVPQAEIVGQRMTHYFPSVDATGLLAEYRAVVETRQPRNFEWQYEADGYRGWYMITATPLRDGMVLSFIDVTDRKRTEEQAEQQAHLYRTTLDASLNSILSMSAIRNPEGAIIDFRIQTANAAVERDLRRKPDELVGRTLLGEFPGNVESGFFSVYARVTDTGQPERIVLYYTDENGFEGWFEVSAVRQEPDGVVITFSNITDNKRAELKAQQAADALQSIMDSAPTAIMFFKAIRENGQIIDFEWLTLNKHTETLTGLRAEQLMGHRLLEIHPHNKPAGLFDQYVQVVETGTPYHTEIAYQADGVDGWYDITASQLNDGLTLTILETSERKRAELQTRQQADLVRSVLDATLTAVACYQAVRDERGQIVDFRFTLANQTTLSVFGLPPEELYTRTLCDLTPKLRGTDSFARYVAVVETGQPTTMERELRGRWYLVSVVRFGDGILTSSIDITENRQYRNQIESANRLLRQSNENLQSFAYVASHDLQEPLRKIRAFGDLLATQYAPQLGKGADYIDRMQAAAERMQALIKDLLTLSRLTTQQQPFDTVNLADVVNAVLTDLETGIQEKKADIRVTNLPRLHGDPLQLRQLFQNLLSNALKFTSETQHPVIRLSSRPAYPLDLPPDVPYNGRQFHEITVSDNGIGFDAEKYRHKVFGAFQRLHNREQYAGTGMGLAIVKKVVENHGGGITVASQEGEGTTFRIFLPS